MSSIQDLRTTVARLRAPGGCPWDREQTHQSLARCLIEETAELLDTIDRGDMDHMREELGDVLLQVVFHAHLAEEQGLFDLEAVAAEINEKLIRRHPHVFGDVQADTTDEVLVNWEKIKTQEKAGKPQAQSKLKSIPKQLPALLYADELLKQLKKAGLEAEATGDLQLAVKDQALDEEAAGKALFELVVLCRQSKLDPESALRRHCRRILDAVEKTPDPQ